MLKDIARSVPGAVLAVLSCLAAAGQPVAPAPRYQSGTASQDGIGKFYYQREIAQVMGFEGAAWLERAERAQEERPDLLVKELHLTPGMTVADVGAGSGYLAKRMAPIVAPGRVLAVDVQPQMVDLLKSLAAQPGLGNIVPILGSPDDSRLPAESIDLAVMVDVYHELAYPYEVVRSIIAALKPGGRLVFVEYRGEDPRVPIKALHKMTVAQIRLEMQPFPITLERSAEDLPIQHIVVFRKR
jgi:ubiquinone/menaquinone biosynthesis C-methylase UbiE